MLRAERIEWGIYMLQTDSQIARRYQSHSSTFTAQVLLFHELTVSTLAL